VSKKYPYGFFLLVDASGGFRPAGKDTLINPIWLSISLLFSFGRDPGGWFQVSGVRCQPALARHDVILSIHCKSPKKVLHFMSIQRQVWARGFSQNLLTPETLN